LREVILRKTGEMPLPAANKLSNSQLTQAGLDSTRVRITGRLLGWHYEQRTLVLEMQSDEHLYFARLANADSPSLRIGSQLALDGVYVSQGQNLWTGARADFFELLLNSSEDIVVLLQPPWWTLKRLMIFVCILIVILLLSTIWITQLRRSVELRTMQLQREIRERERFEHECALAAELSRIARDLHDDLGSSLTEIGVLAGNGQQPDSGENRHASLFHGIARKSRGLITALDGIVWAVDPEDNSLQSLADYLNGYTADFFLHTDIAYDLDVPVVIPKITLEGRVRHDLLMTVKEALNNIVRHAEARAVVFRMVVSDHDLKIEITDDGKGFEIKRKDGNGLKNMASRLQNLGGSCTTESHIGGGTTVIIWMPLPARNRYEV
jgi:signal transduction histidine kinase